MENLMPLTTERIQQALKEYIEKEIEKKDANPNHQIFISESNLIKRLNPESDQDLWLIRTSASTFIDTMNDVSRPEFHIETDIDEIEMARAKAWREQNIERNITQKATPGCLTSILSILAILSIICFS